MEINFSKFLKILVPNAITSMWLGHKDNSSKSSFEQLLNISDKLNTIIRRVGRHIREPAVLLNIAHNYIDDDQIPYLNCDLETTNIHTTSSLDLQFKNGKFELNSHGVANDYIKLYNFYSAFLAKKLYLTDNFKYNWLLEEDEIPGVQTIKYSKD